MRTLRLASIALVAAVSAYAGTAGAETLRDEHEVEIAPVTEGRQPAQPGLSIPALRPKGLNAGADRLTGDTAAPAADSDGAIVALPVSRDHRLGLILAPGAEDDPAHHGDQEISFAGMLRYRQALP